MNLDGSAVLSAPPERVWAVITDPAVLARTIPGCESLEQVGEDEYKMKFWVGVGAIRGTYAGEVRLTDKDLPKSYVMHASGAGAPGNARAQVTINLEPAGDGKTTLTYSADAVIGGPVAGVGQRMITGVAKRMAAQFFAAVDDELQGRTVVPIGSAPSAAAVPSDAAAPTVFTGRAASASAELNIREVALGAVGGAALSLIGVAVGYVLGRRFTYWQ